MPDWLQEFLRGVFTPEVVRVLQFLVALILIGAVIKIGGMILK